MLEKIKNIMNKDIKIQDTKKWTILLVEVISIFIMTLYFNYKVALYYEVNSFILTLINTAILIFTVVTLIITSYIMDKKQIKIEKIFLILSIIFCTLLCAAMPITKGHDESVHALAVYNYSQGSFKNNTKNDILPSGIVKAVQNKSYYEDVIKEQERFVIDNEKIEKCNIDSATYCPISYLPHISGMIVSRLFTNNAIVQLYTARVFNIIFCILILYFAIKNIPFGKNMMLLLALIPICIEGYSTLSVDGVTIAIAFLFISYVLKLTYEKKDIEKETEKEKEKTISKISKKEIIILTILSILVAINKTIYAPLVLLVLIIPKEKFKNKRTKLISLFSIIGISLILDFIWLKLGTSTTSVASISNQTLINMLSNPIAYSQKIIYTFVTRFTKYISEMFGGSLEWNENVTIQIFPIILLITSILLIVKGKKESVKISKTNKFIIAFIIFCVTMLIFTSMYLCWSNPNIDYINGVQGRYFIPILPLILMLFSTKFLDDENTTKNISVIVLLMQIFVILNIFIFHL